MTADLYDLSAYRGAVQEKRQPPGSISSQSLAWVEAHPRFSTDRAYNSAAMLGHFHALRCGLTPDTPEYFAHVEYFTGDRDLPEASARPFDQIEHDNQKWLVWDVTTDFQPIIVRDGRKVSLTAETWTRLGDAVRRVLAGIEEQGR